MNIMLKFKWLRLLGFVLPSMTITSCWDDSLSLIDEENDGDALFLEQDKDLKQDKDEESNNISSSNKEYFSYLLRKDNLKDTFQKLIKGELDLTGLEVALYKENKQWVFFVSEINRKIVIPDDFSMKDIGTILGYILKSGCSLEFNEKDFGNDQECSAIIVACLIVYSECKIFDKIKFTDSAKLGLCKSSCENTISIDILGDCFVEEFFIFCEIIKKLNLQKQCDLYSLISFEEKPVFESSFDSNLSSTSSIQEFYWNKPVTKFGDKSVNGFVKNPQDLKKLAGYLKLFLQSDDISCCDDGKCLLFNQEIKIQFCK